MKLIGGLLTLGFVFTLFFSPVFAQEDSMTQAEEGAVSEGPVDVASIFWPIVPGTTVADGTFFLKQLKETFQGMFTFGNINQAKYQTELSKKRIVEANKLFEEKNYDNALKSLELSENNRKAALKSKKKAFEASDDVLELVNYMVDTFEKEKRVLEYFSQAVPADKKDFFEEQLREIELQISEAK